MRYGRFEARATGAIGEYRRVRRLRHRRVLWRRVFVDATAKNVGRRISSDRGPLAKNEKVLYAGFALFGPISMALLPNGNLIVANTKSNSLVEIESTGAILDTKSVDTGAGGAIRGILALGNSDANTVLYFTDVNANNVQELSK
jgi:hypothetical protein